MSTCLCTYICHNLYVNIYVYITIDKIFTYIKTFVYILDQDIFYISSGLSLAGGKRAHGGRNSVSQPTPFPPAPVAQLLKNLSHSIPKRALTCLQFGM